MWDSRAVVRVREDAGVFIVIVAGEVDHDEDDLLGAAWEEAHDAGPSATVVDLSGVTFADSALLNTLLHAHERHRDDGRALLLAGPLHPEVRALFTLTGTFTHFTFVPSLQHVLHKRKTED
ncbi:STAS domain-containing protein [Streptomyces sp. NPDC057235]|uniref:STAS domain-containing protein n=1 Tax=Streptomyces sp. NPDC057235 TaxID=3346058 RepID=UPI003629BBDD